MTSDTCVALKSNNDFAEQPQSFYNDIITRKTTKFQRELGKITQYILIEYKIIKTYML